MSVKRTQAKEILKTYQGKNPYIIDMSWRLTNDRSFDLTIVKCNYIIRNENFVPFHVNKVVELLDKGGEYLSKSYRLDFIPKKIKVLMIIGDTNDDYHVIAQLSTKDTPKMMFIRKAHFLDDIEWRPLNFGAVDFDRYDERLLDRRGFKLMAHQKVGVDFLLARRGAILADSMGVAKGEPLDTLLYTPNGRKRMGDIQVGDEVIGSNGKATTVSGVFPLGKKKIYRVTFSDGYYLDVTDEHYWEVTSPEIKYEGDYRKFVLDTNQLMDKNGYVEEKCPNGRICRKKTYYKSKNGNLNWQIPIVKPIEFNVGVKLPIEPYLMGVMLGGGHITKSNASAIELPINGVDEILTGVEYRKYVSTETKRKLYVNKYIDALKELGLVRTRSWDKFIPEIYKYASVDERLSLLQGLMDTDGSPLVYKKIGTVGTNITKGAQIITVSEKLCDDIAEIVHSLGGICHKSGGVGSYVKNGVKVICGKYFKLNINLSNGMNPFRVKDKADKYSERKKHDVVRFIKNIEFLGEQEAQCIRVEAENHLYVSNHAIVTHNTIQAIVAALETRYKRVLVVCPAAVKINWEREINIFSDNTSIINGTVFRQARFTIINYDILKNFHTSKGMLEENPNTPINTTLIDAKFDLIIVDEAHNLRNKDSKRGEIISELCTVYGQPRVWLLSGTPVANRPKDFYNLLKLIRTPLTNDYPYYVKRYCKGHKQTVKFRNGSERSTWVANGADNLDELNQRVKHLMIRRMKEDVLDMPEKRVMNLYLKLGKSAKERYDSAWDDYLAERKRRHKGTNIDRKLVETIILRQLVADEAIPFTHELAMDIVDGGEKVVIFTTFDSEQKKLKELLGDIAVFHNGKMTDKQKQISVDRFQTDDSVRVFVGNVISAGAGITLTAGTKTIFNSFSWVPGDNDQAEDRTHRLGQKNDCLVYYMMFEGSVSEIVLRSLKSKNKVISQILGGEKTKSIEDVLLEELVDENGVFI